MRETFHILNGDCLKEVLPLDIEGNIVVCRECLADGYILPDLSLHEFYYFRAGIIENYYQPAKVADYFRDTVSEFQKIATISDDADICLWFEKDVHCQVNLWFVCHLLQLNPKIASKIYWVYPPDGFRNFAELKDEGLIQAFYNRILLYEHDIFSFSRLWKYWAEKNYKSLIEQSTKMDFAYLNDIVNAMFDTERYTLSDRPIKRMLAIMEEFNTKEFRKVFEEFTYSEWIYGYGDVMVKNILNENKISYAE
jgi:hypothetical protein